MKVLLDVDTGVDDSIALLYALFNPEIEIVGISAVCGNVEAWLAAENTMKILDLAEAPDIPVAVGAEKPSCREWDGRVAFIHGKKRAGQCGITSQPPQYKRRGREPVPHGSG